MATVREITTRWGFDIDDRPLRKLQDKVSDLKGSLTVMGVSITAAAGSLFGLAKFTANAGTQASKLSQQLGINAETMQKLIAVATDSGLSTEEFTTHVRFLTRNLFEAAAGSKQAREGFARLGVSLRGTDGRLISSDEALLRVADRFKAMPDGVTKSALALRLFGRSGTQMIPLLNKGSAEIQRLGLRAKDLGQVLDAEAIKNSKEFNNSLKELGSVMLGIRNTVGAKLLPVLTPLIKKYTEMIIANRKLIALRMEAVFKGIAKFLEISWKFASKLLTALRGMAAIFGDVETAAQAVAFSLGIIISLNVLSKIGSLAMAVVNFANAMKAASLAALALQISIGAAFVAIGLIMEDIVAYFQGRDSVLGFLLKKIPEIGTVFQETFAPIFEPFVAFFTRISDATLTWSNALASVVGYVNTLRTAPLRMLGSALQSVGLTGAGNFFQGLGGGTTQAMASPQSLSASGGVVAPQGPAMMANPNITVNVGNNLDPLTAANRVQSGVADGMESTLRNAHRSLAGGVRR